MDQSVLSMYVFGIYLVFVGAGFLFMPNLVLPMFKMPKTEEPWIRVMAVLVLVIAALYLVAAYYNIPVIFWATVFTRFFVLLSFLGLVLAKKARPTLILFGIIDAIGAVWTLITLV